MDISKQSKKNSESLEESMEVQELISESRSHSRSSSVSSVSKKGVKRGRVDQGSSEYVEDVTDTVVNMRKELENFIYTESNKINRNATKFIMSKWMELEQKLYKAEMDNQRLRGRLDVQQSKNEIDTIQNKTTPSYSEITKKQLLTPRTGGSNEIEVPPVVLFIKPVNEAVSEKKSNDDIKESVYKVLKDSKDRIKIRNMRKMRGKGLVMELDSEEDLEIIKRLELNREGLRAEPPKKFQPSLIIYDVDRSLTKAEFIEQLWVKNLKHKNVTKEKCDNSITHRFSIKTKNQEKENWVISLPSDLYKLLIDKGRIFINFYSLKIKSFINITRCFKCFSYGHMAKNCVEKELFCEKCGESGHLKDNCRAKNKLLVCVNCKRARRKEHTHSVKDLKCPEYKKQLENYIRRIEW